MNNELIEAAAARFGNGEPVIQPIGNGLIHGTWKVAYKGSDQAIILQRLNRSTFPPLEKIIDNYQLLFTYLDKQPNGFKIPALVPTLDQQLFWIDEEENFWRATRFITNSKCLAVANTEKEVYYAARSFAELTKSLSGINPSDLYPIIPDFHNLQLRYHQFEEVISNAAIMRLLRATHLISELRQRKKLVHFYNQLSDEASYPTRIMHHDSKISNILFDSETGMVQCPIDLDTVMPGKFFSDIGDMIRTMTCPVDENSTAWEDITIRSKFYFPIICGYLDGTGAILTQKEKDNLHYSGLLMIYMQALRFLADFLNNDRYYHTTYPEQNLNRALNQFILLEQLEEFLEKNYGFTVYN